MSVNEIWDAQLIIEDDCLLEMSDCELLVAAVKRADRQQPMRMATVAASRRWSPQSSRCQACLIDACSA